MNQATGPADPAANGAADPVGGPATDPARRVGTRLLLVAPPFAGHLNPLLTLGQGLRDRGFDVRFATGATKIPLIRGLGFAADALLADDPGVFDRIADTTGPVRSNPILLTRQLSANLALFPRTQTELRAIMRRVRPQVVIADFTAPVAGLVAQEYRIPWLTTTPTPFALETRRGTPSYCGGWGPARHAGHRVRDAAGRGATRAAKRTMQLLLARRFRAAGVRVYRADGSEAAYSPTTILGLGMTELEFDRDWPTGFRMIGPVTATPETAPMPTLPTGPLILVTLGTHVQWAKRELVARVNAMAQSLPDYTFVVSMGRVLEPSTVTPSQSGNVLVHPYLPYDDMLPRCAAVIHHGGAGITYSAIQAGVPALVCPQDYDQFDFAARIVAARAGIRVDRLGTSASIAALRTLLTTDRTPLRALAKVAAGYDPVDATVAAISAELGRSLPGGHGEV